MTHILSSFIAAGPAKKPLEMKLRPYQSVQEEALFLSDRSSLSSSLLLVDAVSPAGAGGENFEAIIDYPSVIAFFIIMLVFASHKMLVNKVTDATSRRIEAFTYLKNLKSREDLSAKHFGTDDNRDVADAMMLYEEALEEEESLRTLIPGIRIAGPNDLNKSRSASKEGFFSMQGPKVLFAMLVLSQLVLLGILAFYPMVMNDVFSHMK